MEADGGAERVIISTLVAKIKDLQLEVERLKQQAPATPTKTSSEPVAKLERATDPTSPTCTTGQL